MTTNKPAPTPIAIHPLIKNRWSPRAFSNQAITTAEMAIMLEAARWAPSCGNEQNWTFVYAFKNDAVSFEALQDLLAPGNQVWTKNAAVLLLTLANTQFEQSGKENYHALHDVGLATQNLLLQATAMNIYAHPMAGYDKDKTKQLLSLENHIVPVTMIALGHPGVAEDLVEPYYSREIAPRQRKEITAISRVFKAVK